MTSRPTRASSRATRGPPFHGVGGSVIMLGRASGPRRNRRSGRNSPGWTWLVVAVAAMTVLSVSAVVGRPRPAGAATPLRVTVTDGGQEAVPGETRAYVLTLSNPTGRATGALT